MGADGFGAQLSLLWGAYAYLREHDLGNVSRTSRLLHECDIPYLRSRLRDELQELAGVVEGTHSHRTPPEDVVLEGSQICYWVYVLALCSGISYEQLSPRAWLEGGLKKGAASEHSGEGVPADEAGLLPILQTALAFVAASCAALGVDTREVVRYDLSQMRGRDYMGGYFEQPAR